MDTQAVSAIPAFLELQMMQPAYTDIEEIIRFRESISAEIAEHFSDRLRDTIRELRLRFGSEIATSANGRVSVSPDEDSSIHFSRPMYRFTFSTSKTRRRDSTGRYNIYFTFAGDVDGKPDTLTIYRIRHAGAAPFTVSD